MNIIENYINVVGKNYCNFNGRADRPTYWYFVLVNFIISLILGFLGETGQIINLIYSLAVLLPSLGVSVRRMHDIGKSGWYILINLIPIAGPIIFIVLCCQPSIPGEYQK